MVRKTDVGHKVLDLIDHGRIDEAFDLFARECNSSTVCRQSGRDHHDVHECAEFCLLPKLTYYSLGGQDLYLEKRITEIKNKLAKRN